MMSIGELASSAGSPFEYSSNDRQAMREQLIRYLLGELDADERRDLHAQLRNSPELQRELAHLRSCFEAHLGDDAPSANPPTDLAARTTVRVTGDASSCEPAANRRQAELSQVGDTPAGLLGWSLADLTVAGGVMLAVSMLIFPALRNSRDGTRRNLCQNNQRQLWVLVTNYADGHKGYYPRIGPHENAGMFVARLIVEGYSQPKELQDLMVCPGAPLADEFRSGHRKLDFPSAESLRHMTPKQLAHVTAAMSPCYNFCFPYQIGNLYYDIKDERRPLVPVFSDASAKEQTGAISLNHGGQITQVTNQDGRLMSLTSVTMPGADDNMYLNDLGDVAAGTSPHDGVLGPSDATPAGEVDAQQGD